MRITAPSEEANSACAYREDETPKSFGGRLHRASEARERPRRVMAHERLLVVERSHEHGDVVGGADIAEHHRRVALQPPRLGASSAST